MISIFCPGYFVYIVFKIATITFKSHDKNMFNHFQFHSGGGEIYFRGKGEKSGLAPFEL